MAKQQPAEPVAYQVREGLTPLPGIGAGPMPAEEYLAREAAYMAQFADDPEAKNPRETRVYVAAAMPLPQGESLPEIEE